MRYPWTVLAASVLGACAIVDPQITSDERDAGANPHVDANTAPSTGSGGRPPIASGGAGAARDGGGGSLGRDSGGGGGPGSGGASGQPEPIGGSDAAASEMDGGSGSGGSGGGGAGGSSGGAAGSTAGSGGAGAGGTTAGTGGSTAGSAGTDPPEPVGESRCYDTLKARPACLGFEQAIMEPWWEAGLGGTVALTGTRTYVGDGALVAHAMEGQARFIGRLEYPAGLKSGSIYLRSYVYVPSSAVLDTVVVLGMSEIDSPFGGITVALKAEGTALDVHPEGAGKNAILVTPATPFHLPRNRWNCVQLTIGISATQGTVQLKVNGTVAVQNETPMATLPGAGYKGLSAGIIYTDPLQPAIDIYVDELVADTAPIPCDAPAKGPLR